MKTARIPGAFIAALMFPFAVRALASLAEAGRMWGVDYLRYLPPAWSAASTLAVLLLIPAAFLIRSRRWNGDIPVAVPVAALLSLAALLLFSPMTTFFYGDGGSYLPNVFRYHETGAYDAHMMLNVRSGILTGMVQHALVTGVPALLPGIDTVLYPYRGMSWIALAILTVAWAVWMRRERGYGTAPLLLALGGAGTLFFLGYVEFYTLPYVLLLVYLLAADSSLSARSSGAPAIVCFILLVASHYMFLALVPSLLIFLVARYDLLAPGRRGARSIAWFCGAGVALWIILYVALGFPSSESRIIMPFFARTTGAGTQAYTLLSAAHLADIANVALLVAPVPIAALLVAFVKDRRAFSTDGARMHVVAIVFFLLFLIFANTVFGLARDYDIMAPLGILLATFAWRVLRDARALPSHTPLLAGIAAVLYVLPWIAVNVSEGRTAARFEDILRLDDEKLYGDYALSGYEALRKHCLHVGDRDGEVRILRRQIELLDYPEHYTLLLNASLAYAELQPARYTDLQIWMLDRLRRRAARLVARGAEKDYNTSRAAIIRLATRIGYHAYINRAAPAVSGAIAGVSTLLQDATPIDVLAGMQAYSDGDYAAAHAKLSAAFRAGFETNLTYGILAAASLHTGDDAGAERYYEAGTAKYPESHEIPMSYGIALAERGRAERASEVLAIAAAKAPPDIRADLQRLLARIRR